MMNGAAYLSNVTNTPDNYTQIFRQFNQQKYKDSAELFIEAPLDFFLFSFAF